MRQGTTICSFVLYVEGNGRLRNGQASKRGSNEMCWVVNEVLGILIDRERELACGYKGKVEAGLERAMLSSLIRHCWVESPACPFYPPLGKIHGATSVRNAES